MADGVRRMVLAQLAPGIDNALIVGIIIASSSPRVITSKKDMSLRSVWNFTLRDSESDFINATFWGSPEYITNNANNFHIGDVVAVTNARVSFRNTSGAGESYRPVVSSPFELSLSENMSEMHHHTLPDAILFERLLHVPTKQSLDFITLKDIQSSGKLMEGNFVNILVAIKTVNPVRQIQSRDGRQLECRELVVFDQTSRGLTVSLWDTEMIVQSAQWKTRETVLFMADIRLQWNSFRKTAAPTVHSRTIVTVDPQTAEAECLRVYALAAIFESRTLIDHMASNFLDLSSIRNVLSVQAIIARAWADIDSNHSEDEQQFTALLYPVVTHLDIDHPNITISRCVSCNKVTEEKTCMNLECPAGQSMEVNSVIRVFNIRIDLTDHTGTLKNCRLVGESAEVVLGCSALQFDEMTHFQRTSLKWSFLMERCAVRILVLKASQVQREPLISILSCTFADLAEVASRLPAL